MDYQKGLSQLEAKERLLKFGPNQIFKPKRVSFFDITLEEIREPMILVLLAVGFFYSLGGKLADALTIFGIIIILVLAEVYNEFRAKKAISSLEKIAAPKTKIFRGGEILEIDSENVVPGDILVLTPGTKVAADAILKKAINVETDESILTGEAFPKEKEIGDEIFAGTVVVSGQGEAEVVSTGKNTKFGQITETLKEIKTPKTPLQLAMKDLAGKLVWLALFFSILIPVIGILRGENLKTMFLTGLALAFVTVPEELPIIITMVLGLGAFSLSKRNFLVKKIKSAEVLGNATCIIADKTGTLTEEKMKVSQIEPKEKEREILKTALNTISEYSFSPIDKEIKEKAKEINLGLPFSEIFRQRDFGAGQKTKAVIKKLEKGLKLFVTGAPEEVFLKCKNVSEEIKEELERETKNGKRVIALSSKNLRAGQENLDFEKIEKEMEFLGLISFEDPLRKGVKETIEIAKKAGIRTIIVTGDHPETAHYIAEKAGIEHSERVLTGQDLDKLDEAKLKEIVKEVSIFARTNPQHKYRLVKALKENGEIVAVTGDGVNDVLALKSADIGIAMGIKGTDVAKEAAGIVLADDNYTTLAQGIFEGRKFFDNLQKGIKYYLSAKLAVVLIFLLPVLIGTPMPFSPIQIIILELFMDLAASMGFVSEPQEKDIYFRKPRNPKLPIFNKELLKDIVLKGVSLFLAVEIFYFWALSQKLSFKEIQTFAFSAWMVGHIALAFVSRSDKETLISQGFFTNRVINLWAIAAFGFLILGIYLPNFAERFNLFPIDIFQFLSIILITNLIIGIWEIKKYLNKIYDKRLS
jgi:Ca2+-transporting ATPase